MIIHSNDTLNISKEQLALWSDRTGMAVEIIHNGRNTIWKVPYGAIAVKSFSDSLKNRIIYIFRKSKAEKSYTNALALLSRGIDTPAPYGYIEKRGTFNFLLASEYICKYEQRIPLKDAIMRYGRECLSAFAGFAARLHQNGIRHDDLNNTNVRVAVDADRNFIFSLIDLNRMKIYPPGQPVPEKECFANLCRFCSFDSEYIFFLKKYLEARDMPPAQLSSAIKAKKRHDRKVDTIKCFKRLFKKK